MLPGSILHSSNYQTVTEADFVVLVCESFFLGEGEGTGGHRTPIPVVSCIQTRFLVGRFCFYPYTESYCL